MIEYSDFTIDSRYIDLKNRKIFNRYIDVFYASAMIGCLKGLQVERADVNFNIIEKTSKIKKDTFRENEDKFLLYEKVILITHYDRIKSNEKIKEIVLSNERKKEYMTILEQYAYKGIDVLYNKYFSNEEGKVMKKYELLKNGTYFMNSFNDLISLKKKVNQENFF